MKEWMERFRNVAGALVVAALTVLTPPAAHAEMYMEPFGGVNLSSLEFLAADGDQGLNRATSMSGIYGLRVGAYRESWGGEVELQHACPHLKQDMVTTDPMVTHTLIPGRLLCVNTLAVHGLLRYRWAFGGVGPALFQAHLGKDSCWQAFPPGCGLNPARASDSEQKATAVGLSVKLGVAIPLTERWSLPLTYAFQHASFQFSGQPVPGTVGGFAERLEPYLLQSVTVGLRYSW